jgi:hypothetical protein
LGSSLLLLLLFGVLLVASAVPLGPAVEAGGASCSSCVMPELLLLLLLCSSRAASSACLTGTSGLAVDMCCSWPQLAAQLLLLLLLPAVGARTAGSSVALFRLPGRLLLLLEALLLEALLECMLQDQHLEKPWDCDSNIKR